MSNPLVMRFVLDQPWAILPEKLEAIVHMVRRHHLGVRFTDEEIKAAVGNAREPQASSVGAIGVLPLYGTISQRADMLTDMSGGTALTRFARQWRAMATDPSLKAIVLDVDSPGGTVYGVQEMAAEILDARNGTRPIVAVANSMAASAAYWIGSAADEVVITPSGVVGSIGVYIAHEDCSAMLEKEGVKVTFVAAGDGKVEGNPAEPLSDAAREKFQRLVNVAYADFTAAVSKGRGVSADTVRNGWKADIYTAREAVALGLADRVATLEETLARLSSGAGRRSAMAADSGDADIRLRLARLSDSGA